MKLWKATVEVEVLIASEESPTDDDIADAVAQEMDDNSPYCCDIGHAFQIDELSEIPDDWLDTLPQGEHGSKTCRQIMEAYLDAKEQAAARRPMPNQKELSLGPDSYIPPVS